MSGMFTTCPGCRMNLAVTATDLRVGQGYVRCGRCDRVFNALLSLAEDNDETEPSGHAATGTTTVPALEDPPVDAPSAAPQESNDEAEWARITPLRSEPHPDVDVDLVESQPTGTFETIVLEGDGILQTEEHVDENELEEQLQRIARQIEADAQAGAAPVDEPAAGPVGEPVGEPADEPAAGPDIDADEAVGNPRRAHWAWSVAAILLLLTLGGQIVHHQRQSLVAQPLLQAPLQRVYGLFGVALEPAWDLKAYDLRALGGEALSGTSTTIVLRATVHNRSTNRQPPPMIRVVLQDRFLNAVSTTAIAPADYLRGAAPERMAPDQRLDVELRLEDPHRQAGGFELDACLPGRGGTLHCSNDP